MLWIYLAVTFGYLLGWTAPPLLTAIVAVAGLAAIATALRSRDRWYIPPALPLGIWIAVVLSGWLREEQLLRCDDLRALRPPVQLVVPNPQTAACRPGEVRRAGRFPRTTWEAPDGQRVVFTTQGEAVPGGFDGAVCEAHLPAVGPAVCVGPPVNKSQGLAELVDADRLLVMQWGVRTPSRTSGGVIYELPRQEGIRILSEHWLDEMTGDGFYEPRNATLFMFSDRMNGIHRVTFPSFEREPTIPLDIATPGEVRYDQTMGEGVACGERVGVALRGDPLTMRRFADASAPLIDKLSVSWGCDWDPQARKVYSTIPNLGLLDRIDYDSGKVEARWFVGPGMRSVAYDRARRRVYFTNFLRGEVVAFDERSGEVTDRWFVGRFSRWVRLTRDGRALLATGNLGVVRIPLE